MSINYQCLIQMNITQQSHSTADVHGVYLHYIAIMLQLILNLIVVILVLMASKHEQCPNCMALIFLQTSPRLTNGLPCIQISMEWGNQNQKKYRLQFSTGISAKVSIIDHIWISKVVATNANEIWQKKLPQTESIKNICNKRCEPQQITCSHRQSSDWQNKQQPPEDRILVLTPNIFPFAGYKYIHYSWSCIQP